MCMNDRTRKVQTTDEVTSAVFAARILTGEIDERDLTPERRAQMKRRTRTLRVVPKSR